MHTRTYLTTLASFIHLTACQLDPKDIGTPDTASDSTASAGADPSTSATETASGTDGGDSDPGATDPGATDPGTGATDPGTGATDPGTGVTATDTGDTDDTDTDGVGDCGMPDPPAAADFTVKLDAWPGQSDEEHDIERACTIDAVSSDDVTVTTLLTCDVDGVPLGAALELAAAPEGAVDWTVGQAVTLRSRVFNDDFEGDVRVRMTLDGDPGGLLVDGQDWWGDGVPESQQIGPILRERLMFCVPRIEDIRYPLRYSLAADASVTIMSGGRGALLVDAAPVYAIDLAFSGTDCCHGSEHSLIRRVRP